MQRHSIDISWATLWRVFFFLVAVVVMYLGVQIMLGLFLAIVISAGLDSIVSFLERRGVPRTLGVILIFLLFILLFILLIYTFLPSLISDLNKVVSQFDRTAA